VHFLNQGLHYGGGIFEGIRCYQTSKGPAVFRLKDHITRFSNSARIMGMELPFKEKELVEAVKATLRINKLDEGYIRPCAYYGYGRMGLIIIDSKIDVGIAVWPWGSYLGKDGLEKGIKCKISSYSRENLNSTIHAAKITGIYFNSLLAKREAMKAGYAEGILLDGEGNVTEGSGENIFLVKGNDIYTPPLEKALPGITRKSVIAFTKDLGYTIHEKLFKVEEFCAADELFFSGTAAEITPISQVDENIIGTGKRGPITNKIQDMFFRIVHGKEEQYSDWLDLVNK
jgi:branched-chain amino acid aminotransferase